jgi:hypothetical protein
VTGAPLTAQHLHPDLGEEVRYRSYAGDCSLYRPGEGVNWGAIRATLLDEFVVAHALGARTLLAARACCRQRVGAAPCLPAAALEPARMLRACWYRHGLMRAHQMQRQGASAAGASFNGGMHVARSGALRPPQ